MRRLALVFLLVPVFVAACGGNSGDSELAEAPTAPPSEAPTEAAPAPTPPASAEEPAAPAAPQGEEIGEQRGIGGDEPAAEAPMEAEPAPPASEDEPREEDTSRPEAPVITGSDLDGNPLSIEDFKGTPVIVKVFAEH
ncbi:MAG: TlpA family protein disulfide reductase [Gaiellaceae bacterium]